jgi:hypothetical protein
MYDAMRLSVHFAFREYDPIHQRRGWQTSNHFTHQKRRLLLVYSGAKALSLSADDLDKSEGRYPPSSLS